MKPRFSTFRPQLRCLGRLLDHFQREALQRRRRGELPDKPFYNINKINKSLETKINTAARKQFERLIIINASRHRIYNGSDQKTNDINYNIKKHVIINYTNILYRLLNKNNKTNVSDHINSTCSAP